MVNEMSESESAAQVAGFVIRFGNETLPSTEFTTADLQWFANGDYWGGGEDQNESNHKE